MNIGLCAPLIAILIETIPADPVSWLITPERISIVGLLLLAIIAFYRGWVVTGVACDAIKRERDALRGASDALLKSYQDRENEERLWRRDRRLYGKDDDGDGGV